MSRMRLEERRERKKYINNLTPLERGIYADMLMRSLRGSWRQPRKRTLLIEMIGQSGEVEIYEKEKLREKASHYFEKIGRGAPDGRYWRGTYEAEDIDVTQLPESTVRDLASHIPNDETWVDWRISKEFSSDDDK